MEAQTTETLTERPELIDPTEWKRELLASGRAIICRQVRVDWPETVQTCLPHDMLVAYWWSRVIGCCPAVAVSYLHHVAVTAGSVDVDRLSALLTPIDGGSVLEPGSIVDEWNVIDNIVAAARYRLVLCTEHELLLPTLVPQPGSVSFEHIEALLRGDD
jgi:hypothetical protein